MYHLLLKKDVNLLCSRSVLWFKYGNSNEGIDWICACRRRMKEQQKRNLWKIMKTLANNWQQLY